MQNLKKQKKNNIIIIIIFLGIVILSGFAFLSYYNEFSVIISTLKEYINFEVNWNFFKTLYWKYDLKILFFFIFSSFTGYIRMCLIDLFYKNYNTKFDWNRNKKEYEKKNVFNIGLFCIFLVATWLLFHDLENFKLIMWIYVFFCAAYQLFKFCALTVRMRSFGIFFWTTLQFFLFCTGFFFMFNLIL